MIKGSDVARFKESVIKASC